MITTDWNEDAGIAQCVITDVSNNIELHGFGMAVCHSNDKDFQSERTGVFIAQTRANIDILRQKRDYDLKPSLMALKHLKATMVNSQHYNKKSYENKRLNKEIKNKEDEIDFINKCIQTTKSMLKEYIDKKDRLYQAERKGQN